MTQPRTAGRLGRLPHDPFRDALHLGPHLTGAAPPNPPVVDWLSRVQGWPMYGNDQWGAEFAGLTKEPNPFPAPSPAPPPAPTPGPVPDAADLELARVLAPWLREHHVGGNHRAQQAVLAWEAAKGIPDMAGRG